METPPLEERRAVLPTRKDTDLRLVPLGFAAMITVGAMLLTLPQTHLPGRTVSSIDALFLATSATCVTGLSTINVAETFNIYGQAVLLLLIQAGGLGIFTASLSLVLLSGNRLSLSDEQTIQATVGRIKQARPLDIFIYSCVFVFLIEFAGAVALHSRIVEITPDPGLWQPVWEAVFHSVSAFCNAGISTYPDNLMHWRHDQAILWVISALVVLGGIGLMTLINLRYFYFWRRDPRRRGRLTLQTRLSLLSALILLVAGGAFTWIFELRHTLAGLPVGQQVSWAFFHSAMARTAGFNVVDNGMMNPPTLLLTLLLMFIGGAPGSMAGGIKTLTFIVLLLTAWSALRRRDEIQFWNRRLSPKISFIATMITLLAAACILMAVGLLMFFEDGQPASRTNQNWLGIVFEVVSAFGTVGLSTGVTPLLTVPGKTVIMLLMFIGRIVPLMLAIFLARPAAAIRVRHPREEISLG